MKKILLISLIGALSLVAIGLTAYLYFLPTPETISLESHHIDKERGFKINYPSTFTPKEILDKDKDEVSLEIVQPAPQLTVTVWQESGLGLLETFSSQPLLQQLRDNVDRRFSSAYPEIEKEGVNGVDLAGQEAFSVQLTFRRPKALNRERMHLTVTTRNESAYYVQCLTPVADWDEVKELCLAITGSFEFL
ncbi:hypothetical protein KC644_04195 [Candidatus Berkelbacteria bacterium]|nr:hypothetical protein [Candidatus Berkelbacteria bacterium]